MSENKIAYNEYAMEKLVEEDGYLSFVFKDLMNRGHEKKDLLKILFNSYVDGDSVYELQYKKVLNTIH